LILLDETRPGTLTWIWVITAIWIVIRAAFGMLRIWPGIGNSPLAESTALENQAKGKSQPCPESISQVEMNKEG
jgi:hypothetical protein